MFKVLLGEHWGLGWSAYSALVRLENRTSTMCYKLTGSSDYTCLVLQPRLTWEVNKKHFKYSSLDVEGQQQHQLELIRDETVLMSALSLIRTTLWSKLEHSFTWNLHMVNSIAKWRRISQNGAWTIFCPDDQLLLMWTLWFSCENRKTELKTLQMVGPFLVEGVRKKW